MANMRKQRDIWEKEHADSASFLRLHGFEPQSGVVDYHHFFISHGILPPRKIIDIGCGKGRNTIYLANNGFEVYGIDYSQTALDIAKAQAKTRYLLDLVHFSNIEIDKKWLFEDNFFDLALDCFSSIDIETLEGRECYKQELFRTLKPGGYALVIVVSAEDELEKEMIQNNPGQEKNSSIWPSNGKFQKNYDKEELLTFYKNFDLIELKEIKKSANKLDRHYTATNFCLLLQKP
jgi:SAM-dependent methyltransferase